MFEGIMKFFKNINKKEEKVVPNNSKDAAKERLHLVLMQDRANMSADFLELMKQEIIEVIKKYIDVDEKAIDVRLTNKENDDGTNGAPALYANIPILNIKNDARKVDVKKDVTKNVTKETDTQSKTKENEKVKTQSTETSIKQEAEVVLDETEKNKTNIEKEEQPKQKEEKEKQNETEKVEEGIIVDSKENIETQENKEDLKKSKEKIKSEN